MRRLIGAQAKAESTAQAAPEPSVIDLFARSLDTVQETITRLKLAAQPPDLLITIPRNVCTFYDFHRAESVIEWGRKRTREALARWTPPANGFRN
jgi:NTE family protein